MAVHGSTHGSAPSREINLENGAEDYVAGTNEEEDFMLRIATFAKAAEKRWTSISRRSSYSHLAPASRTGCARHRTGSTRDSRVDGAPPIRPAMMTRPAGGTAACSVVFCRATRESLTTRIRTSF